MNDDIRKALKELAGGESIYISPEVGITNRQIKYNSFTSDADAMRAASNFMVPMTDAEGKAYYEDLPTAIFELDSKGTLDVYKALYGGQFSDAQRRQDLELKFQEAHPEFDAPETGVYEVMEPGAADEFAPKFQYIPVREEAGSTEDNDYTFAIPVSADAVIAVNGKVHEGVTFLPIDGTNLYGGVVFEKDVPVLNDTIIVIGNGEKYWGEVCEKNGKRFDSQLKELKEEIAGQEDEAMTLLTQLNDSKAKAEANFAEAAEEGKKLDQSAHEAMEAAQAADNEVDALEKHKTSLADLTESTDYRKTERNAEAEIEAIKDAIAGTNAAIAKAQSTSQKKQSVVGENKDIWASIEKALISWDLKGNDGDDGIDGEAA